MAVNFDALDLSEAEARVYQKILVSGQLNRGEIATTVGLGMNQLPSILEQLKSKNLIREIPGLVHRYAALLPLGSTKDQLEAAVAEVEVLSKEIEATSQSAQENLKQNLDQSKAQLDQEIQQEISNLNNQIAGVKEQVSQEKAGTQQQMASQMQENNETVERQIKGANQQISIKASGFRGDAVGRIDSQKEVVDRRAKQALEAHQPIKEQYVSELAGIDLSGIDQVKTNSDQKIQELEGQATQSLVQVDERIKQTISAVHDQFNSQLGIVRTKSQEFQDETTRILNETQTGLEEHLSRQDQMINQLSTGISEQIAGNKQALENIDTEQKETIQSFSQQAEALNSKAEAGLDQLNTNFRASTDQIGGELSSFVQTTEQTLRQQSSTLEDEVQTLINQKAEFIRNTLQTQIQQFIEQTNAQLESLTKDVTSSLQAKTQALGNQRAEQRQQVEAGIASQVSSVKNSYQGLVDQHKQENRNQTNAIKQQLETLTQRTEEQLQGRMEEMEGIHSQLSSTANANAAELGTWKEQVRETVRQFQDNQLELYGKSIRQVLQTMEEELTNQRTQLEQLSSSTHTQLTEQLQTTNSGIRSELGTSIQQFKESLNGLQENLLNRFRSSMDEVMQQYANLITENQTNSLETLDLLRQDTERVEQDILSSMQEIITKVDTDFKQLTSTLQGSIEEFTSSAYNKVLNQVDEVEKISTTTLSSVERLSSSGTAMQLNVVEQSFNEYNSKFRQSTARVSDRVLSLAQLLDNLFQMQQGTETPTIKTSHIVGKDSIINYMSEMIGRVKSKITILAPSTSMINDDQVLALPMTAQVTIVSEIDEVSDRDWIDKMHGAKANVTLRSLTTQGFGAKLPDFIGCEREGEEIIVGTMDEGNNEYVAIASNSENFVRIFGSQIISEYARGRSKQLQK